MDTENNTFLACNSNYLRNDCFFYAGALVAMSVVHGAPGRSASGYRYMTHGQKEECIQRKAWRMYDVELRILYSTDIKEYHQNLVSDRILETALELGCTLQIFTKTRCFKCCLFFPNVNPWA